jgi:hypothetical protein
MSNTLDAAPLGKTTVRSSDMTVIEPVGGVSDEMIIPNLINEPTTT